MKIIDSIPEGKLSTLEAIDAFLSDVYDEPNIERPMPVQRLNMQGYRSGIGNLQLTIEKNGV